jgi:hypothetical protein
VQARRSFVGERREHRGSRLADIAETLDQQLLRISLPQLDVIGSRRVGVEADRVAYDKCGGFGFGLAGGARGIGATVAPVQKFVREFVGQRRELLGRRLAGKQRDFAATRHASRGSDSLGVFERNALCGSEPAQSLSIPAGITSHGADMRKFLPVGLADVEDVRSAKPGERARRFFAVLFVILRFTAEDRREDEDALLAFLDEPAELVPGAEARDIARIGLLRSDQQDIMKAKCLLPDYVNRAIGVSGIKADLGVQWLIYGFGEINIVGPGKIKAPPPAVPGASGQEDRPFEIKNRSRGRWLWEQVCRGFA